MAPPRLIGIALWAGLCALAADARAQPLVADLSDHLIAITTGFSGAELLLFGATEGEGDVVITVRGPDAPTTVRRKSRIAGVWVNRDSVEFGGVPSFYRVMANRPIEDIAAPALRARHQLGVEHLRFQPPPGREPAEIAIFRAGLIRNKARAELFPERPGEVGFLGPRLFRVKVELPANVPTGAYTVEFLLIRGGAVIAAQTTPMFVSKVGVGAEVYEFAHRQAAAYGVLAVAIAAFAGWLASVAFRRG